MASEEDSEPTVEATDSVSGGTELGLDAELLAALGYVLAVVGPLVLLVVEDDDFIHFHAAQSLLFTAAVIAVQIALSILGFVPFVGVLADILSVVVWIATLLGVLFLAYKSISGERYELPVLAAYVDDVVAIF